MAEARPQGLRQIKWAFSRLAANLVNRNLNFWNWRSLSFFAFAANSSGYRKTSGLMESCATMVHRVDRRCPLSKAVLSCE